MFDMLICIILVINVILLVINSFTYSENSKNFKGFGQQIDGLKESQNKLLSMLSNPDNVNMSSTIEDNIVDVQTVNGNIVNGKIVNGKSVDGTIVNGKIVNGKIVTVTGVSYKPKKVIFDDVVRTTKYDADTKTITIENIVGYGTVQINDIRLNPSTRQASDQTPTTNKPDFKAGDFYEDKIVLYDVLYEPSDVYFGEQSDAIQILSESDYDIVYSSRIKSLTITKKVGDFKPNDAYVGFSKTGFIKIETTKTNIHQTD